MPEDIDTLIRHAIEVQGGGNAAEAERLYLTILKNAPHRADARFNLAAIYRNQNRLPEAFGELQKAVETKPDFGIAWLSLSECAALLGQDDLSLQASAQAIQHSPEMPQAWLRHGIALSRARRDAEAATSYRQATMLEPTMLQGWINLSISLKNSGQPQEADAVLEQALALSGSTAATDDNAENSYNLLHWHLALSKLGLGDYAKGFAYFRARYKGGTSWKRYAAPQQLWRGENLAGKTILVTAEQGHGDLLMMARYLPLLKAQGAKVLFQVHPALRSCFTGWDGADEIVAIGETPTAAFDFHTSIFDLPYRFQTTMESIPAQKCYLPLPAFDEKTNLSNDGRKKIGVVCTGQSQNVRDRIRSIPLEIFAGIFSDSFTFYNLTFETKPDDAVLLAQHHVTDLRPRIGNFADTAKFVQQFDLVICCDTAIAPSGGWYGQAGLDPVALHTGLALEL